MAGPKWVHWQAGDWLAAHAVEGGRDINGSKIYVGRLPHAGDILPAKVVPQDNFASVSYDGKEIAKRNCEILCQVHVNWVKDSHGCVPAGATPVGRTASGETLYAGRVRHKGGLIVGKVHPSHGVCYIPFGGKEIAYREYEVLTM